MTQTISIFSSDTNELNSLKKLLTNSEYSVFTYTEVTQDNINKVYSTKTDLLLVDLNINNSDGIDLCFQLKKQRGISAFVVLYAELEADYIQVEAFKAGADDYIIKPINPRILVKKIKALLKRKSENKEIKPKLISYNELEIDRDRYRVIYGDKEITLPRKEFEILFLLINTPKKVFSRDEIFKKVWQTHSENTRVIDVHIRKIRKRLGNNVIKTVKGVGYQLT